MGDPIGSGPETLTADACDVFVDVELPEGVDDAELGDPPQPTRTMLKLTPAAKPRAMSLRLCLADGLVPITDSPDLMDYPPLEALEPHPDCSCQVWHSLPRAEDFNQRSSPPATCGLGSIPKTDSARRHR